MQSRNASSAVVASSPSEQPRVTIDRKSWDEVITASEAFLQKKFNPRITEMKLSELLLNCVQHATTQTESGPMAGRLLSVVLENNIDCRPTAKLMHMVRKRCETAMIYDFRLHPLVAIISQVLFWFVDD